MTEHNSLTQLRENLLRKAEDSRIRAKYHPTLEKRHEELQRAKQFEEHALSETIFGKLV